MDIKWEEGFVIRTGVQAHAVVISANREGLLSLADQLIALAKEETGSHIHYDDGNSLDNGSMDLIIEKI